MISVADLREGQVMGWIRTGPLAAAVRDRIGEVTEVRRIPGRSPVFELMSARGRTILRFPRDAEHLAALEKEEAVQSGLRFLVNLAMPDTRVVAGDGNRPAAAVHTRIEGEPLTGECYDGLSSAARGRLVSDLVTFFLQTHSVALPVAYGWLGIDDAAAPSELASRLGKPLWFAPAWQAEMRRRLHTRLDARMLDCLDDTVSRFLQLPARAEYLVFGHGDMHGYNMAVADDELDPRLVGVFDLENAGVLDVHEDFFRLGLVSEDLLERVLAAYERRSPRFPALDRARIAVYYRAFLYYLMDEMVVQDRSNEFQNLENMLLAHLDRRDLS